MKNKKIIIGLTGQIACGKGVIKNFLIKEYQASDYRFSTILRDVLTRLHIEQSRENIQKMSTLIRKTFGEDSLANAMSEDIKNDKHHFIVIDGIRRLDDIKHLKEVAGFFLVSIEADQKIRYQRLIERNENPGDAEKSFADFLKDEQGESELEIPKTMQSANFTIDNNGTWDQLWEQIHDLVKKIDKMNKEQK
ncbi:MAG: AAA family ATPase [Patescibacteria group bacterium]|jgi:dephospho-CoA kinase